ncbi:unnamed protein product [Staurois parvus]|uniref:Uncharacterized protein n=1 Tax=Staurois parvus TaxID=386267 RepID=A0ABN9FFL3_9NEOB|nr:unnamed protein product [Staurois parvus]
MVGVTGQVQQVAISVVQRVRQRDGQGHKPGIKTGNKQRSTEGQAEGQKQAGAGGRVVRTSRGQYRQSSSRVRTEVTGSGNQGQANSTTSH